MRLNKHIRIVQQNQSPSRSPSGISKPQKSIGYSNDMMEFSPRMSRSPGYTPPLKQRDDGFTTKNLIFWNKNERNLKAIQKKDGSPPKKEATIFKEIGTLIKKIQNNSEKQKEEIKTPTSTVTVTHVVKNNNISQKNSEESTKATFENNLSDRVPKQLNDKTQEIRAHIQDEKNKIALNLLKLKNNQELFLENQDAIISQLKNFKTQADFFRKVKKINESPLPVN